VHGIRREAGAGLTRLMKHTRSKQFSETRENSGMKRAIALAVILALGIAPVAQISQPGGGGSASVPTGTGFTHITAGAQDAAASKVDLADSADVEGKLIHTMIPNWRKGWNYTCDWHNATSACPLGSSVSGSGAAANAGNSAAGHPGILNCATGTTTSGRCGVMTSNTVNTYSTADGDWTYSAVVRHANLSAVAEEFITVAGWANTQFADPAHGAWFEYDRLGDGTNWRCQARNNSGTLFNDDSGVAVANNGWQTLEITYTVSSTTIKFYIDGVQVCGDEVMTLGASPLVSPMNNIRKTAGTTSRTMDVDVTEATQIFGTPRT
jgi:hypothetical protein